MDEPRRASLEDYLGARAGDRPPPRFGGVVGVVGGILIAAAVFSVLGEISDDATRVAGAGLSIALLVAAFGALIVRADGPIHLAGVAAATVAVGPLVFFALFDPDGFDGATGDFTAMFFLAGAVYAGFYLLGPSRGHAIFLAGALTALLLIVIVQLASPADFDPFSGLTVEPQSSFEDDDFSSEFEFDDDFTTDDDFQFEDDFTAEEDFDFEQDFEFEEQPATQPGGGNDVGIASLVVGAAYLAAAIVLGRRGLAGAATPFLAVGDVALLVGVSAVGADAGAAAGGFLAIVVGGLLVWFAAATARRGTAWFGGLFVFGGILAIIGEITDDEPIPNAIAFLIAGAAVVAAAEAITRPRPETPETPESPESPTPTPAPEP